MATTDKQAIGVYALVSVTCLGAAWLMAGRPLPKALDDEPHRSPVSAADHMPMRTASIELGGRHILNPQIVSAFIPTGSTSKKCLLTMSESNFASPGATVFCAYRRYRGANGVIVRIYLAAPPPSTVLMEATIYQEGARRYGRPILYAG